MRSLASLTADPNWVRPIYYLAKTHPHPRDACVFYNPSEHLYMVDRAGVGVFEPTRGSVSGRYVPFFGDEKPFDAKTVASKLVTSGKARQAHYKWYAPEYMVMTDDDVTWDITRRWGMTAGRGIALHEVAERHTNGEEFSPDRFPEWVESFLKWQQKEARTEPYRTEWVIWHDLLGGMVDQVRVSRVQDHGPDTLCLDLRDYKFMTTMTKTGPPGKGLCADLVDCKHDHYLVSMSIYAFILETNYSGAVHNGRTFATIHIANAFLDQIWPGGYKVHRLELRRDIAKAIVEAHLAACSC